MTRSYLVIILKFIQKCCYCQIFLSCRCCIALSYNILWIAEWSLFCRSYSNLRSLLSYQNILSIIILLQISIIFLTWISWLAWSKWPFLICAFCSSWCWIPSWYLNWGIIWFRSLTSSSTRWLWQFLCNLILWSWWI